ncbi:MAG TPA: MGMT family protein [Candidatus Angelobacter sp.]|nr:MGMT family protein [Candidatus Angelobacter sp.]
MLAQIRATISKIPRGKVSTYGKIASVAGFPGAARQVVRALQRAYDIPWHRVVAAGGRIALPGEAGMEQRFRLESEGVGFSGRRVRMAEFEFEFQKAKSGKKPPKALKKSAKKTKKKKAMNNARKRIAR